MTALWRFLYRLSRAKLRIAAGPHLVCVDCGARLHRGDKYTVLEVRHDNCRDTKLVGQMSLEE
jgi:hypothetical protein